MHFTYPAALRVVVAEVKTLRTRVEEESTEGGREATRELTGDRCQSTTTYKFNSSFRDIDLGCTRVAQVYSMFAAITDIDLDRPEIPVDTIFWLVPRCLSSIYQREPILVATLDPLVSRIRCTSFADGFGIISHTGP